MFSNGLSHGGRNKLLILVYCMMAILEKRAEFVRNQAIFAELSLEILSNKTINIPTHQNVDVKHRWTPRWIFRKQEDVLKSNGKVSLQSRFIIRFLFCVLNLEAWRIESYWYQRHFFIHS